MLAHDAKNARFLTSPEAPGITGFRTAFNTRNSTSRYARVDAAGTSCSIVYRQGYSRRIGQVC